MLSHNAWLQLAQARRELIDNVLDELVEPLSVLVGHAGGSLGATGSSGLGPWMTSFSEGAGAMIARAIRQLSTTAPAIPVAVFFYLLWHAPRGLDGTALLVFAVAMLIAVRVSVAAYEIPSTALTPELAPDYDKRTSLLAYRYFFAITAMECMT